MSVLSIRHHNIWSLTKLSSTRVLFSWSNSDQPFIVIQESIKTEPLSCVWSVRKSSPAWIRIAVARSECISLDVWWTPSERTSRRTSWIRPEWLVCSPDVNVAVIPRHSSGTFRIALWLHRWLSSPQRNSPSVSHDRDPSAKDNDEIERRLCRASRTFVLGRWCWLSYSRICRMGMTIGLKLQRGKCEVVREENSSSFTFCWILSDWSRNRLRTSTSDPVHSVE